MAEMNFTCVCCNVAILPRINKTTGLPSKAPRKYCSSDCSDKHRASIRDRSRDAPRKPKEVCCERCHKIVLRRVRGGQSDAGRFCSRECAFAAMSAAKAQRDIERQAKQRAQRLVRSEASALRRIASYVERPVLLSVSCRHCGEGFKARRNGGLHKIVCDNCKRAREKALRRAAKLHRKAIKRGANADRIDPVKVFERDKWRCHLCGCMTAKKYRGTANDKAPELEHIVSLADGGSHTWGNVACSCRKCNIKKGARSSGQLGLGFTA